MHVRPSPRARDAALAHLVALLRHGGLLGCSHGLEIRRVAGAGTRGRGPGAPGRETRGIGIFPWASNDDSAEPDVVLGCAGDFPTLVIDVIDRVPGIARTHPDLSRHMVDERLRCRRHTRLHGEDVPDVADRAWPG